MKCQMYRTCSENGVDNSSILSYMIYIGYVKCQVQDMLKEKNAHIPYTYPAHMVLYEMSLFVQWTYGTSLCGVIP